MLRTYVYERIYVLLKYDPWLVTTPWFVTFETFTHCVSLVCLCLALGIVSLLVYHTMTAVYINRRIANGCKCTDSAIPALTWGLGLDRKLPQQLIIYAFFRPFFVVDTSINRTRYSTCINNIIPLHVLRNILAAVMSQSLIRKSRVTVGVTC